MENTTLQRINTSAKPQRRTSTGSVIHSGGTLLRTDNFIIEVDTATQQDGSNPARMMASLPVVSPLSSSLFRIKVYHAKNSQKILWQTVPGLPFIRSAVGNDSLTPGNGEYRIIQNNNFLTTHQTISFYGSYKDDGNIGKTFIKFEGMLLYQKRGKNGRPRGPPIPNDDSPVPVLNYTFLLYESSDNILELKVTISPHADTKIQGFDRIHLTSFLPDNESIFGLGEQFSFWNLNGLKVPILTREQGIGRGLQPVTYILNHVPPRAPSYAGADTLSTYTAIGHYISSACNSVYLHNSELAFFDFSETNRSTIEVVSNEARISLFYADRPLDMIKHYTKSISGRMQKLPDWASGKVGAVVGIQGGESKVIRVIETLRSWNVKVAAVWLQDWVGMRSQYMDFTFPIPFLIPGFPSSSSATISIKSTSPQKRLWWNWEYDRTSYPNWPSFVKKLRTEYDIRVMTYINPFLTDVERGGKPRDSFSQNYFKEASDKGFLVKQWEKLSDGSWKLSDYIFSSGPGVLAGIIDITNPDARIWYKDLIITNMISLGVSGWMADFGEYLPFNAIMYANRNRGPPEADEKTNIEGRLLHNLYPVEWAKLNDEAVKEASSKFGEDILFFTRSASPQSPQFSRSFWVGDQMHTWDHLDGLESSILAQLSSSLSGMAYSHSDIGGYTTLNVDPRVMVKIGNRTSHVRLPILERRARFVRQESELFERWMEVGSLMSTSMFRTHEGSVPDENIQIWDRKDIGLKFGFFTDLFCSLSSYKDLLSTEHDLNGYAPVRPMFLHYPQLGSPVWAMERIQYMLGPILLIIPITTPNITKLNQKITEPPVDDDDGEESENLLKEFGDSIEPDDSSDEEFEESSLWSVKGRILRVLRNWSQTYILASIRGILSFVSVGNELTHQNNTAQIRSGRWPNYGSRPRIQANLITAPKDLPKPLHGRPFLPPGRWLHVFSGKEILVTKASGVFLTEQFAYADISALPGEPAVFLRLYSRDELKDIISRGLAGLSTAEDWKYWVEERLTTIKEADIFELSDFAWRKYVKFHTSLKDFLNFAKTRTYPRDPVADITLFDLQQ